MSRHPACRRVGVSGRQRPRHRHSSRCRAPAHQEASHGDQGPAVLRLSLRAAASRRSPPPRHVCRRCHQPMARPHQSSAQRRLDAAVRARRARHRPACDPRPGHHRDHGALPAGGRRALDGRGVALGAAAIDGRVAPAGRRGHRRADGPEPKAHGCATARARTSASAEGDVPRAGWPSARSLPCALSPDDSLTSDSGARGWLCMAREHRTSPDNKSSAGLVLRSGRGTSPAVTVGWLLRSLTWRSWRPRGQVADRRRGRRFGSRWS